MSEFREPGVEPRLARSAVLGFRALVAGAVFMASALVADAAPRRRPGPSRLAARAPGFRIARMHRRPRGAGGFWATCANRAGCRSACRGGHDASCVRLAVMMRWGYGGPKDAAGALGLVRAGCRRGGAQCCGMAYQWETSARDKARLQRRGRRASGDLCRAGDAEACRVRYQVARDQKAALPYLWRACHLGHLGICNDMVVALGYREWHKPAVKARLERETKRAIPIAQRLCRAGSVDSCKALGTLEKTPLSARKVMRAGYDKLCQGGYAPACYPLGILFRDRFPNRRRAKASLDRGCRLGFRQACQERFWNDPRYPGLYRITRWTRSARGCGKPWRPASRRGTPFFRLKLLKTTSVRILRLFRCAKADPGTCRLERFISFPEETRAGWDPMITAEAVGGGGRCTQVVTVATVQLTRRGARIRITTRRRVQKRSRCGADGLRKRYRAIPCQRDEILEGRRVRER